MSNINKRTVNEMVNEYLSLNEELKKIGEDIKGYQNRLAVIDAEIKLSNTSAMSRMKEIGEILGKRNPLFSREIVIKKRLKVLKDVLRPLKRCRVLKADIIAGALHPNRIGRLLEQGGFELVEATLGY